MNFRKFINFSSPFINGLKWCLDCIKVSYKIRGSITITHDHYPSPSPMIITHHHQPSPSPNTITHRHHPPLSSTAIIHRYHPPLSSTAIIHRYHLPLSFTAIIHRRRPLILPTDPRCGPLMVIGSSNTDG